jgi:thioredoxin-related protein
MAKPIVNGIEKDLQGQAKVVRLNLLNKLGRELARAYGVTAIPAMIIFDGGGRVRYSHKGVPNRQRIVQEVSQLGG